MKKINVAAIVTPDMIETTREIAATIEDLCLTIDVFCDPKEAKDLAMKHLEENDILLFGGPIPYLVAHDFFKRNEISMNKPMIYVPYNEISIYRGLFKMLKTAETNHDQPFQFSIDYPAESEIRECLEELEISIEQTFTKECGFNEDLDDLAQFHYRLWEKKQVQAVITSVYSVYHQLKGLGLPTYRISPAKSSIRNTIKQALLEGKNLHQVESQIAIGLIGIHESHSGKRWGDSDYKIKRKKLELQQLLIDFGEDIQAIIDWSDHGEIRFITTRGQIESITNHFQSIDILQRIEEELHLTAFIGIGFGSTAHEAEFKAYEGFSKAKSHDNSSCFIVELDGHVHGPIGESAQLTYSVRSNHPELLTIAKTAGLSIGTINKLLAFNENLSTKTFTAHDLANGFGITIRSARRILSKLEEHHYVNIIGEEQPISRGRPRQIYKLAFIV
ncbi:transcriptional regulator [Anaerobacillus sp. MEB173]|uniref:transcriptional regulator n=1 Tax=Anaerobacillus sp. MEB173 TaxID=3383345 RepID=UPI003F9120B0